MHSTQAHVRPSSLLPLPAKQAAQPRLQACRALSPLRSQGSREHVLALGHEQYYTCKADRQALLSSLTRDAAAQQAAASRHCTGAFPPVNDARHSCYCGVCHTCAERLLSSGQGPAAEAVPCIVLEISCMPAFSILGGQGG